MEKFFFLKPMQFDPSLSRYNNEKFQEHFAFNCQFQTRIDISDTLTVITSTADLYLFYTQKHWPCLRNERSFRFLKIKFISTFLQCTF